MKITIPIEKEIRVNLRAGDQIYLSGVMYTARDAAHLRLVNLIKEGRELPVPLQDQVIYYVGPAPASPGNVIGSAGPTTSYRMDPLTPILLENGLGAMIGKGARSEKVKKSMKANKAVYLAAVGGAAALIARKILKAEIVAFPELGPEAIRKLEVRDFPAIVINDVSGNDLYQQRMNLRSNR